MDAASCFGCACALLRAGMEAGVQCSSVVSFGVFAAEEKGTVGSCVSAAGGVVGRQLGMGDSLLVVPGLGEKGGHGLIGWLGSLTDAVAFDRVVGVSEVLWFVLAVDWGPNSLGADDDSETGDGATLVFFTSVGAGQVKVAVEGEGARRVRVAGVNLGIFTRS